VGQVGPGAGDRAAAAAAAEKDAGMKVAMATGEEGGDEEEAAGDEVASEGDGDDEAAADKPRKRAGATRRRGGGGRRARARGRGEKEAARSAATGKRDKADRAKRASKGQAGGERKRKGKGKGDFLDSLIDNAMGDEGGGKAKKAKKAKKDKPAPASNLPKQLNMNQIRRSMSKVKGLVQSCYDKHQVEGRANVKLTITPKGKPTNVRVKGKFFGTDTGACVARAVKRARFPKFSGAPMAISYPFLLQ
jgi:hypothetical protein